jgi:hypothetical protein
VISAAAWIHGTIAFDGERSRDPSSRRDRDATNAIARRHPRRQSLFLVGRRRPSYRNGKRLSHKPNRLYESNNGRFR